jgi:hypothetical protein
MPVPAGGATTLPAWAPTLSEVAAYCTARTTVAQPDGTNREELAFGGATRPTDVQVTRFIQDACGWVLMRTGPLDDSLTGQANAAATVRCAGFVEMRVPERSSATRDEAIATAKELLRQADAMREDLAKANEAATGTDPEDPAAHIMPVWSFPPAPCDVGYRREPYCY